MDNNKKQKSKKQVQTKSLLLSQDTPFSVKESFNMLRTNVLYMPTEYDGGTVIAITSAEESTGKSSTIANLAISFAQSSKKVILIDADMRCPRQYTFWNIKKNELGLSEHLAGINTIDEVIIKNVRDGLDVIPSGHVPPSASELVLSSRFAKLLAELKERYDFVFIDFPPIGVVADAAAVANCITGYIFVIRANHSDAIGVKNALQALENVDANILGIVFNDLDFKAPGNRYCKYGRYGKYGKYGKYSRYGNSYSYASKYARQAAEAAQENKEQ